MHMQISIHQCGTGVTHTALLWLTPHAPYVRQRCCHSAGATCATLARDELVCASNHSGRYLRRHTCGRTHSCRCGPPTRALALQDDTACSRKTSIQLARSHCRVRALVGVIRGAMRMARRTCVSGCFSSSGSRTVTRV